MTDLAEPNPVAPEPGPPGAVGVSGVLARVEAAVAELGALDLEGVGDDELSGLVVGLEAAGARLESARSRVLDAWDRRGVWRADGARSGGSWLAHRARMPARAAAARVRLARQLRHLPATAQALAAGVIGVEHVGVLAAARTARTADAFAAAEAALVTVAASVPWPRFCATVAEWLQRADPDGADQDAGEMFEARRLTCVKTWRGLGHLQGLLEPIGADIVTGELARLEDLLFAADWAAAKATHGPQPRAHHLARSPAQRRHDALVWMAQRSAGAAPHTSPQPLFTVHVGLDSARRICQLADGTVLAPATVAPWLARALTTAPPHTTTTIEIERVVFDTPSRILDVSRRARLFRGATRRAVEVRDRTCVWPGCHQPAHRCEIDHLHPYALGGETTQHNATTLCPHHHRLRDRGYRIQRDPTGHIHIHRPDGHRLE